MNLRKKKCMFCFTYNPQNSSITTHTESTGKVVDSPSDKHEHFIFIGDFNATEFVTSVEYFCDIYRNKNLIKNLTCFKKPHNRKCIHLIMTNRSRRFQNSCVIETGLCDFHKIQRL